MSRRTGGQTRRLTGTRRGADKKKVHRGEKVVQREPGAQAFIGQEIVRLSAYRAVWRNKPKRAMGCAAFAFARAAWFGWIRPLETGASTRETSGGNPARQSRQNRRDRSW